MCPLVLYSRGLIAQEDIDANADANAYYVARGIAKALLCIRKSVLNYTVLGAPVAKWVKRWPKI